jgi:hypothetical protein
MSAQAILICYAVGAAALAFWWIVRFPRVGPHRPARALAAMLGAWVGMSVSLALFDGVAAWGRFGPAAAMALLVLPALTAAFWAAACVLRSLLAPGR